MLFATQSYASWDFGFGFNKASNKPNILPSAVTQIPADTIGPELITNQADRELSSDTGWWTETNTSISGGVATITANNGTISKNGLLFFGAKYQGIFTISGYTSGSIGMGSGTTLSAGRFPNGNGTFVVPFVQDGSAGSFILVSTVAGPSFDNISVKTIKYGIGTKSVYSTTWRQNIDGIVISGDTAGVLSIVDIGSGAKGYQIANSGSANVVVSIAPSRNLIVGRTYRLDITAKKTAGTTAATFTLDGGVATNINSASFIALTSRIQAASVSDAFKITVPAGTTIQFYNPRLR